MSKPAANPFVRCRSVLLGLALISGALAARADQVKANNNSNLESGSSWASGIAPGAGDNAIWDSTVATPTNCTNTLGAPAVWSGIIIYSPSAPLAVNGNTTLTLNSGINMTGAAVDLVLNCGTINLGSNQTWSVASGRTLTTGSSSSSGSVNSPNNGNWIVTKTGGGIWTTSGTGDNGSSGIIVSAGTVALNKTSSGGTHAVGGPGLTVNNGGTARITGTGGDQIYNGASVTLANGGIFDLNGHSETFAGLNGSGGIVDNTAAGTSASLILSNGSSLFSGTIQNSGNAATLTLVKAGTGTSTLNGVNSYTGGTIVSGGTLALNTTANVAMPYTVSGGTLSVTAANSGSSLPMTSLTLSSGNVQLTFNLGGVRNRTAPVLNDAGNLSMNGDVPVNAQNLAQSGTYLLLQYGGTRSGSGSFVPGTMPLGATLTDDTVNKRLTLTYASPLAPRVVIPTLNTNEVVVAVATPQQYGAVGDGITDDSTAFQNAMNAVYNNGGSGGGVVFVPSGNYAFYTNLSIPTGVTLHGDWADWSKTENGMTGTTFKVYFGAGQATNAPFITLNGSTALRDVNIWYPNQNPNNIVAYPFTIGLGSDCVVQNVALLNSYQGIETFNGGDKHILSTVIGTPLYRGIDLDQIFDVCHAEDIRFSPDAWPVSGMTNAPVAGGSYASWMRTNGTAMRLKRVDGEMCYGVYLSGYLVGIEANAAANGQPGVAVYGGSVSNCATALLAQDMPSAFGLMFANFTLDGDIAVSRTNTAGDANAMFDHCTLVGRNGTAISSTGNDWHSWMQFQHCTISNALQLAGPGVINVVDSTLLGSTQCVLSANATRAAFTGCTFSPSQKIVNFGNVSNLLVDPRQSSSNALPSVYWTNVVNDYVSRKAAKTNLYVVTDTPWGAYGDGIHDDTAAIQVALAAAGASGGIVYVPAGKYKLTDSLDLPGGVELRGAFEMRHRTRPGADGHAKGTVLLPYGGQGTTNGPPAVVLEANSGLVGVTISYETQNTKCIPFPPAIQGRGGNVYIIGVCCPNPYYYVDLDTYTCTNHFLDMVDGWALRTGYNIGNGSSGTILDCHCNWTYWIDNSDSQSSLPQSVQAPVLSFVSHQLQMYVLGNCKELMLKDFSIIENMFVNCVDEGGLGPNLTLINSYCDATIQGFVLNAAAPCNIEAVNTPMTTFNFGNYSDLAEATVAVLSTPQFQGTARFISSVLWGGTYLDFNVNGGDVGFDMVHMDGHSFIGSIVNGGVFHLVNNSAYISYSGASNFPPYTVTFGPKAGVAGKTNEFIACYAYNGCGYINAATNAPTQVWNDYALSRYSLLDPSFPVIFAAYPNGSSLFAYTNTFNFSVSAPAGIATSNIVVILDGVTLSNLVFTGASTGWNVSYPNVTLNATHTAVVTIVDNAGHAASVAVSFDTFSPNTYTFEAEDFDYTSNGVSGLFIDTPQTNAYAGLGAKDGVDCHNASGGSASYRPNPDGLATETAGDGPRPAYVNGLQDYDVGWNNGGNWGNYTRTFPAGIFHIYMRAASPNGSPVTADAASMSLVTSGFGTTNQTTARMGTFAVPNTGGWHAFTWVPLQDAAGNLVQFTNSSGIKTLRVTTDNGGYNANFYDLAPVTASPAPISLAGSLTGTNIIVSFQTQFGFAYQLEYKTNLTDPNWFPLGGRISGNGSVRHLGEPLLGGNAFYRMEIQPNQ